MPGMRRIRTLLLAAMAAALLPLGWTATGMAADKVVRIWHTETAPETITALTAIARRFEALNPGIRIEAEGLPWADLEGKIASALASGAPPELSHGQPITCTALQAKGLLLPLDEVVTALGEANVWKQVRPVCHAQGRQFGLVHAVATSLLIYRRDMAAPLGIGQPASWAGMIAAAKALTRDTDGDGRIDVYGVTLPGDNLFINILLGELIKANDGVLFDANHRPRLTDPRMIEVLHYLSQLLKYAVPGWEGQNYLRTFQNLTEGKAAIMLFGHGRGAGIIERSVPSERADDRTFAVWTKPQGPSGSRPAVQVDEEPWMLFKDAKHPKEAIEFLKFFYRDDNYFDYVATVPVHLLPITESLRKSARYRSLPALQRWQSWVDMQQSYLDKDEAKPALSMEWSDLNERPYLLDVLNSGILRDMVMAVVIEKEKPAEAARIAQERLERLLQSKGVPGGEPPRKQSALKR
jgi:ABC-type glycerol-3-phosphate transport system substrate-binding protein